MGLVMMLSVGAVLAGLLLGFQDLWPYLAAQRSGVITRKGARSLRVSRDEDPEGFGRLLANRGKGAAIGFGLFMLGWLGLSLVGLMFAGYGGPLAIVIFVGYFCFVLFAAFCLIRGLITGHMFAFWGLTLFGSAAREQNPTWFWTYTAINLFVVLCGIAALLPR